MLLLQGWTVARTCRARSHDGSSKCTKHIPFRNYQVAVQPLSRRPCGRDPDGYSLPGLHACFTAGEQEVRAWTIHGGFTAPRAAAVIHTDFERGFMRAETSTAGTRAIAVRERSWDSAHFMLPCEPVSENCGHTSEQRRGAPCCRCNGIPLGATELPIICFLPFGLSRPDSSSASANDGRVVSEMCTRCCEPGGDQAAGRGAGPQRHPNVRQGR
jgi:hypothetical protein